MSVQIKLLLATVFWGATPTIGRFLAEYQAAFVAVFGRFLFAGIILSLFCSNEKAWQKIPRSLWLRFLLLGLFGICLHNGLLFKALEHTTATNASVLIGLIAPQVVILDLLIHRLVPKVAVVGGVLLGFVGAAIVVADGSWETLKALTVGLGETLVFFSALAWAIYTVVIRPVFEQLPTLLATTVATWVGVGFLFPFLFEQPMVSLAMFTDWTALGLMFVLGFIGSALGFLWYNEAVIELGTVGAALYINLVPLCGILWAALLLGEDLTLSVFLGGGMVLAGLMLVNPPRRKGSDLVSDS